MCLDVIERESLHHRTDRTELPGFLQCAIVVLFVDQYALDKPHCRGAVSASAMNQRRLIAGLGDCFEEVIGHRGVRGISAQWEVHEVDAGNKTASPVVVRSDLPEPSIGSPQR